MPAIHGNKTHVHTHSASAHFASCRNRANGGEPCAKRSPLCERGKKVRGIYAREQETREVTVHTRHKDTRGKDETRGMEKELSASRLRAALSLLPHGGW